MKISYINWYKHAINQTKHTTMQREKKRILSEYSTTENNTKCAADQNNVIVQSKAKLILIKVRVIAL